MTSARNIDENVVKMSFDNREFEEGVSQTLGTIDRLKGALQFGNVADGLDEVSKKAAKIDFSSGADGLEKLVVKVRLLENVVDTVYNKIEQKLSQLKHGIENSLFLGFNQFKGGWNRYMSELKNVQVMMNATGASIEEVEGNLQKLMWFTDETSYDYQAMAENISRFTNAGIGLDDATNQMIGIANAAGLAGIEASQATHAMDGFSKAMSAGFMSYQNWSWIRTARMDTMEFKQMLIDGAVEAGTLTKTLDGAYKTAKGTLVTVENMETTLSERWLDKTAMGITLGQFSDFANIVYNFQEAYEEMTGEYLSSAEIFEKLDDVYENSEEEIKAYQKAVESATGEIISYEEAQQKLATWTETSAEKAFKASSEYRSFSDVLDATADAAKSSWARTYKNIFGNAVESKKLWTTMGGIFYDIAVAPLEGIEEVTERFSEWGGLQLINDLVDNLWTNITLIKDAISDVMDAFKDADEDVEKRSGLADFLAKLNTLIEVIRPTEEELKGFKMVMEALLSPLNKVKDIFGLLGKGLVVFVLLIDEALNKIFTFVGKFDNLKEMFNYLGGELTAKIKPFLNFVKVIGSGLWNSGVFPEFMYKTADAIRNFVESVRNGNFFDSIKSWVQTLIDMANPYVKPIFDALEPVFEFVSKFFNRLKYDVGVVITLVQRLYSAFTGKGYTSFDQFTEDYSNTIDFLIHRLQLIKQNVLEFVSIIKTHLKSAISKAITWTTELGKVIKKKLINSGVELYNILGKIIEFVYDFIYLTRMNIATFIENVKEAGTNWIDFLFNPAYAEQRTAIMTESFNALKTVVTSLAEKAKEFGTSLRDNIYKFAKDKFGVDLESIVSNVGSWLIIIRDILKDLADKVLSKIRTFIDSLKQDSDIGDWLVTAVGKISTVISDLITLITDKLSPYLEKSGKDVGKFTTFTDGLKNSVSGATTALIGLIGANFANTMDENGKVAEKTGEKFNIVNGVLKHLLPSMTAYADETDNIQTAWLTVDEVSEEALANMEKTQEKASEIVDTEKIDDATEAVTGLATAEKEAITITDALKNLAIKGIEAIGNVDWLSKIGQVATYIAEMPTEQKVVLAGIASGLGIIRTIGKTSSKVVTESTKSTTDSVKSLRTSVGDLLTTLGSPAEALAKAITGFKFDEGVKSSFTGLLDSLTGAAKRYGKDTLSQFISNIAKAILMLSGALVILSMANPDSLLKVGIGLGIAGAALVAFGSAMSKFVDSDVMNKLGFALPVYALGLSTSIAVMVGAFTALRKIESNPGKTIGALGILTSLGAILVGASVLISRFSGPIAQSAASIIATALAIGIMESVLNKALGHGLLSKLVDELKSVFLKLRDLFVELDSKFKTMGFGETWFKAILVTIGAIALLFTTINGLSNTVKNVAMTIVAMSAAALLLSGLIKKLGEMNTGQLNKGLKGITRIAIIFGAYAALLLWVTGENSKMEAGETGNLFGKWLLKRGTFTSALRAVSTAADVLMKMTALVYILGKIPAADIAKGEGALLGLTILMAGMMALTRIVQKVSLGGLLSTIILMTTIVTALFTMALIDYGKIQDSIWAFLAVAGTLITLTGILAFVSTKAELTKGLVTSLEVMLISLAVIFAMYSSMTSRDLGNSEKVNELLVKFFESLAPMFISLAVVSTFAHNGSWKAIGMVAAVIAAIIGAVTLASNYMSMNGAAAIAQLSEVIVSFGVLIALLTPIMPELTVLMAIAPGQVLLAFGVIDAFIGALTLTFVGVAALIGKLSGDNASGNIQKGMSLIGDFAEGLGAAIRRFGAALIGVEIEDGTSAMDTFSQEIGNAIGNVVKSITDLSAADPKTALANLATIEKVFDRMRELAKSLSEKSGLFGGDRASADIQKAQPAFTSIFGFIKDIAKQVSEINTAYGELNTDVITAVVTVGDYLITFSTRLRRFSTDAIPKLTSFFSETIPSLADAMSGLSQLSGIDIDMDKVESAIGIATIIAEDLLPAMPNMSGSAQELLGDKVAGLSGFAAQLEPLGTGISKFVGSITQSGITADGVSEACNSALAFAGLAAELYSLIPETGGIIQKWTGVSSLQTLGEQLVPFGTKMAEFSSAMAGYTNESKIDQFAASFPNLVDGISRIPEKSDYSYINKWSGTLSKLGSDMAEFASKAEEYSTSGSIARLVDDLKKMSDVSYIIDQINPYMIDGFGVRIKNLANNIKIASETINQTNHGAFADALSDARLIRETYETLIGIDPANIQGALDLIAKIKNLSGQTSQGFALAASEIDSGSANYVAKGATATNKIITASNSDAQKIGYAYEQNMFQLFGGIEAQADELTEEQTQKFITYQDDQEAQLEENIKENYQQRTEAEQEIADKEQSDVAETIAKNPDVPEAYGDKAEEAKDEFVEGISDPDIDKTAHAQGWEAISNWWAGVEQGYKDKGALGAVSAAWNGIFEDSDWQDINFAGIEEIGAKAGKVLSASATKAAEEEAGKTGEGGTGATGEGGTGATGGGGTGATGGGGGGGSSKAIQKEEKTFASLMKQYEIGGEVVDRLYDSNKQLFDLIGDEGANGWQKAQKFVTDYAEKLYLAAGGTDTLLDASNTDLDKIEEKLKGMVQSLEQLGKEAASSFKSLDLLAERADEHTVEDEEVVSSWDILHNMQKNVDFKKQLYDLYDQLRVSGIDPEVLKYIIEKEGATNKQYLEALLFGAGDADWVKQLNETFKEAVQLDESSESYFHGLFIDMAYMNSDAYAEGIKKQKEAIAGEMVGVIQNAEETTKAWLESLPPEETAGYASGMRFLESLQALESQCYEASQNYGETSVKGIESTFNKEKGMKIAGAFGDGLYEGLASYFDDFSKLCRELGKTAYTSIEDEGEIASPSKKTYWAGQMFGEGLIQGIESTMDGVGKTSRRLSSTVLDGFNTSVAQLSQIVSDEVPDPVITPTLDLSNVRNGVAEANRLFDGSQALKAGASSAPSAGTVLNYTQNNYSPKSLTRTEIYRQTRNQLSAAKRTH